MYNLVFIQTALPRTQKFSPLAYNIDSLITIIHIIGLREWTYCQLSRIPLLHDCHVIFVRKIHQLLISRSGPTSIGVHIRIYLAHYQSSQLLVHFFQFSSIIYRVLPLVHDFFTVILYFICKNCVTSSFSYRSVLSVGLTLLVKDHFYASTLPFISLGFLMIQCLSDLSL